MVKKYIIPTIVAFFLLINIASALTIDINIKPSFSIGETIFFTYTITSDITQEITYIPHVTCPNAPIALLQQKSAELKENQSLTETYYDITITEDIEPQECTAYIYITSPVEQYVSRNFTIVTNPSFDFNIKTCKDSSCKQGAKTFLLNENIHIDYSSSVSDPLITTTLTYPNKKTKKINLPYSFKAKEIGTYNLEITASKEGYKTITKKEQFGVIEKNPSIGYAVFEDDKEKVSIRDEKKKDKTKYLIILLSALVFLVGFIVFLILRKKKSRLGETSVIVKK